MELAEEEGLEEMEIVLVLEGVALDVGLPELVEVILVSERVAEIDALFAKLCNADVVR